MLRHIALLSTLIFMFTLSAEDTTEEKTAAQKLSTDDKTLLKKYIYTRSTESAQKYLEKLKASSIDARHLEKAGRLRYRNEFRKFNLVHQNLQQLTSLTDTEKEKISKDVDTWLASCKQAMTYIFDDKHYAVPAKAQTGWISGQDIQTNQGFVEGYAEICIDQWNSLLKNFGRYAGISVAASGSPGGGGFAKKLNDLKSPSQIQIPVLKYNFSDPEQGVKKFARKAKGRYTAFKKMFDAIKIEIVLAGKLGYKPKDLKLQSLQLAVAAMFDGNITDAMAYFPKDSKDKKIFVFYVNLYLFHESLEPKGWSASEKKALKTNNLYRMALGLHPMVADEKLYVCATQHSKYQTKFGLGHTQKDETMRTPFHRAKVAGYKGGVTENCSSGDMGDAIWGWRSDAGHHRNLIRPKSKVVGISDAGYPTHNTGTICHDKKLAAYYNTNW